MELQALAWRSAVDAAGPEGAHLGGEAVEVPLLAVVGHAVGGDDRLGGLGQLLHGPVAQVLALEDLVAQAVDDLALLVHDLVVLEDVLADLGVAGLDGVLRLLDGLGDHLRLERHVVGERLAHDVGHGAGGEEAHELVLEGQVEAALARIALAPGAATELVVDPAGLVALGAEHVEAAELAHLVALGLALGDVLLGEHRGRGPRPRRCPARAPRPGASRAPSPRGCRRG